MVTTATFAAPAPWRRPVRVGPDATVRQAAAAMEDNRASAVMVGDHPSALVTEHDLTNAMAAGCTGDASVAVVATRAPVWTTPTTTLGDAVRMMASHRVRHLVVVDDEGRPVGLVDAADVLDSVANLLA